MKKKISIEDIENSVSLLDISESKETGKKTEKTEVLFKKKKNRKKRRYIIIGVIFVILTGLGVLGWVTYNSIKNIMGEGSPGLLGLFDKNELKGESEGRVNVLLIGVGDAGHQGATLADTVMVMSVDTVNKKVAMLSIPRDMYVRIEGNGMSKINAAHAYGEEQSKGNGPELLSKTVSSVLAIPIHYYVRVDFTGFKKIIDTVGGVDVYVEKDLYDPYYPNTGFQGYQPFYIKKGMQHLDGATALKYARSRTTTSDFDRARRQQQVISALQAKITSAETLLNPKKLLEIISIVGDHLKTNFQTNEFQRIVELSKQVDKNNVINKVLDNSPDGLLTSSSGAAGYILVPKLGLEKYDDIQTLVKNIFNENTIQSENARISVLNGTTASGLAMTLHDKLKGLGYNTVHYGSAPIQTQKYTVIYDYTNGSKSKTIEELKTLLSATVVKKSGGNYDIEIIIGQNYKP